MIKQMQTLLSVDNIYFCIMKWSALLWNPQLASTKFRDLLLKKVDPANGAFGSRIGFTFTRGTP